MDSLDSVDFEKLFDGSMNSGIGILMAIVCGLIVICGIVAIVIAIVLAIRYAKYNKKQNSCGLTGEKIARRVLDENGLENIAVTCSGSFLFGNSYSHYFKKVRLRRRTWQKDSVTSLAMAAEKSCLAILDKEGDPDMEMRVRLTPVIELGPLAFIPLILIGVVIDILLHKTIGILSAVMAALGLALYLFAFIMSVKTLKTEKKAQERALALTAADGLANDEEIADMRDLFKLYNIEYINNMILSMLELLLRILQIIAKVKGSSSSSD